MTPDELRAGVARLKPWFHCIDLGNGVVTKTESVMGEPVDHPAAPWRTIGTCLPADLGGKSVLDVGCNAGFYAIEAKRRGAARVLGVDGQRHHVRQALFVRRALGLDIEYRRMNVYELSRATVGRFDITLALGLVYHLKHLVLALERLFEVTDDLLVVETQVMPEIQTPASFEHPLGVTQMSLHLLALVDNPPDAKEQVYNWFLPSPGALASLLRNTGFAEVEIFEVKNERAILLCRKRARRGLFRGAVEPAAPPWSHHQARITVLEAPASARRGDALTFRLRVANAGLIPWPMHGEPGTDAGSVQLGSHLLRDDEEEIAWDYGRARLPRDLGPGETAEVSITLPAPDAAGRYVVEFDMVAEQRTWFEDHGSGTLRAPIDVA